MYSVCDNLKEVGFPHSEIPGYNGCLSPSPGLSQTTTSFIASNCLGIHHMRLFAWPYNLSNLLIALKPYRYNLLAYTHSLKLKNFEPVLCGVHKTTDLPRTFLLRSEVLLSVICLSPDNRLKYANSIKRFLALRIFTNEELLFGKTLTSSVWGYC